MMAGDEQARARGELSAGHLILAADPLPVSAGERWQLERVERNKKAKKDVRPKRAIAMTEGGVGASIVHFLSRAVLLPSRPGRAGQKSMAGAIWVTLVSRPR